MLSNVGLQTLKERRECICATHCCIGILNKLTSFLPSGVLQTIYNTLILPHLIYGILSWGHTQMSFIAEQLW